MKPIRTLLATVLTLLVGLSLHAQNPFDLPPLAGGERWLLREWDESQTVTLSQPETPNVCYEWSGPGIESGWNTPTITATPVDSVNIYTVRRISQCGVDEAQITVRLTDTISIVNVYPKKCFNNGDTMRREDFIIVTNPPGHEDWVFLMPIIARNNTQGPGNPDDDLVNTGVIGKQTVTFRLDWNGHTSIKSTEVDVVNDNLTASTTISPDFLQFEENLKKAEEMFDKGMEVLDKGVEALSGGLKMCGFDKGSSIAIVAPQWTFYCCDGEIVSAFNFLLPGTVSASASFECAIPIPGYSFPYFGGLHVILSITGSVSTGPYNIHFRGKCTSVDVPLEFAVEFAGGVRAQFLHKDFLSASLKVAGSGKTGIEFALGNGSSGINFKGVEVTASIVGELKAYSLFGIGVNYPLKTWTLFNSSPLITLD